MIRLTVAKILEEKGMSVLAFSKAANINYRTALDLQRGNSRRVDLETLDKVCSALDVTPADLFEYTPTKHR
jgi:DNA-binding Xre family transcriptional regulator